ncbi:MAG TPA: nucleotide disphospho-sugar-binding domain-containing protein [Stellaceae bacterium]|nr:nucleotide disphospho-sugar-binding domain-containing protein [Stellaceae bacterium]
MSRILFLAFSGGGNLPPSLGIARELTARGHKVVFAGDPEMMPRLKPTPFRAIELTQAYAQLDKYPEGPFGRWFCQLTSFAVEEQVRAIVEAENPDFILIDFMFLAALNQALSSGRPSAVMAHMAFFRVTDAFRGLTQMCSAIREQAGFAALPSFDELVFSRDRVIVTSLGAIDQAPSVVPLTRKVCHVGPALETEAHARPLNLPWDPTDTVPLVLVSFSTDPIQATPDLIQRSLEALGRLDVHVVATVGAGVDIGKLSIPRNALAVEAADHEPLMAKAALVVTHGGHGTVMRALKHGVPMLVMPGIAPDQSPNAKTVEALGAGRVLAQDADSEAIGSLAHELLATSHYRAHAQQLARLFSGVDGAIGAADEIERLLVRSGLAAEDPEPAIMQHLARAT